MELVVEGGRREADLPFEHDHGGEEAPDVLAAQHFCKIRYI